MGHNLRAAFYWAASRPYVSYHVSGNLGLAHFASYGFNNGYGNCYVMAAVFCVMARELGYEAYEISGYVPSLNGGMTPHSWVEVKVNGRWYVCDPDFTEETGGNGYLIWYGTPGTWMYASYWRMGN